MGRLEIQGPSSVFFGSIVFKAISVALPSFSFCRPFPSGISPPLHGCRLRCFSNPLDGNDRRVPHIEPVNRRQQCADKEPGVRNQKHRQTPPMHPVRRVTQGGPICPNLLPVQIFRIPLRYGGLSGSLHLQVAWLVNNQGLAGPKSALVCETPKEMRCAVQALPSIWPAHPRKGRQVRANREVRRRS